MVSAAFPVPVRRRRQRNPQHRGGPASLDLAQLRPAGDDCQPALQSEPGRTAGSGVRSAGGRRHAVLPLPPMSLSENAVAADLHTDRAGLHTDPTGSPGFFSTYPTVAEGFQPESVAGQSADRKGLKTAARRAKPDRARTDASGYVAPAAAFVFHGDRPDRAAGDDGQWAPRRSSEIRARPQNLASIQSPRGTRRAEPAPVSDPVVAAGVSARGRIRARGLNLSPRCRSAHREHHSWCGQTKPLRDTPVRRVKT